MAYVPGFSSDLFFSYAQNDSPEWIRALMESLTQQLKDRLGPEVSIWKDTKNIRFGQNWEEEIRDSVIKSAAFLAVVSPSYQYSNWCAQERKLFLEHWRTLNQLKVGRYYRFLKLLKLPWPDGGHEQFHPELQQVSFFERRKDIEQEIEFVPGTDEFRSRVNAAGWAIASLLTELRRGREAVFLATATEDCQTAYSDLREELRAQAYNVRPDGLLDDGFTDDFIKNQVESAILSVHLLGEKYDPFTEHQIELASSLQRRLVFWLLPQSENTADPKQKKLIESIKLEEKKGKWAWLNNPSVRSVIGDILAMLRPQPLPQPIDRNGNSARIYLICDPTTEEDILNARMIQAQIGESERMTVELPIGASGNSAALHERLLAECDGLLLYRKAAPKEWLLEMSGDVAYAENLVQRPKVKSKAFLLNDASLLRRTGGVTVIPEPGEFQISHLEPFLAPLRMRGQVAAN